MENTYSLNAIVQAYSTTGNETLSLSYYGGNTSLVVFAKDGSKKPLIKISLPQAAVIKLRAIIKQIIDAQPGTRMTFEQQIYDKDSKQFKLGSGIIFVKNDKRCIEIELTNRSLQSPLVFKLACPNSFAAEGNPLTDEERSKLQAQVWLETLNNDFMNRMNSRFNMPKPQGNSNYRSNNNGGSNGGNYRRDYQANNSNPDTKSFEDDLSSF